MRLISLIAVGLCLSSQAAARDWPSAGGWDIIQGDDYCAMSLEYEGAGSTELYFILKIDGGNMLGVSNAGWSAKEGEKYSLRYVLNNVTFEGGDSIGAKYGYKPGFLTSMAPGFTHHFAAGSSLWIFRGDTLVDQLSLEGTSAAMPTLRRCVAYVRAENEKAAREKARLAHIPIDPFADPSPADEQPVRASMGASLRSGSITDADYPALALRVGAEGTSVARYLIDTDGRVASCAITSSSGNAALDETTCKLIERRFRFRPAMDQFGNPTTETRTQRQVWRLPRN